jgi:hypothetical protein
MKYVDYFENSSRNTLINSKAFSWMDNWSEESKSTLKIVLNIFSMYIWLFMKSVYIFSKLDGCCVAVSLLGK